MKNNIKITGINFNSPLKILMFLFSFVFVFAAIDGSNELPLTLTLRSIFYCNPVFHSKFFSIFELLTLFMILLFVAKYIKGINYSQSRKISKFLFISIIVCFLLDTINPNVDIGNVSTLFGLPILTHPYRYIYILLVYFLLFVNDNIYLAFTKKLFIYIVNLAILRVIILYFLWFIGIGTKKFYGIASIMSETDVLIIIALVSTLFYSIYLCTTNKKYIRLFYLFALFLLLSFKRSAFLLMIIPIFLIYTYKQLGVKKGYKNLVRTFLYAFIVISVSIIGITILKNYNINYLDRMFGMFINKSTRIASDSGHFLQSERTLNFAIERISFWGAGLGTSHAEYEVLGASTAGGGYVIHNIYAALWIYRGFYMIIFILILFIISFLELININRNKQNNVKFKIFKSAIIFFFIAMLIMWYFHPYMMFDHIKMRFIWVSLIVFIIRFKPEHISYLLGEN